MKKFLFIILGLIIAGSIINNIKTQYGTLKEAEKQNLKVEMEINKLKEENKIIGQKLEYATSSAFFDQKAHEDLGMGKENDVWLKLKPEEKIDLFPKAKQEQEIPIIKQWIKVFTQ